LTVILHSESSRRAKALVKFSGMCCTITIPGAFSGIISKKIRRASVPPVEAPTTTTFSVVWIMALEGLVDDDVGRVFR